MPTSYSQPSGPKPTPLLAILAASLVAAHDPTWLRSPVADLAQRAGFRADRVSRLKRRLLAPFERLLKEATQRGRRPTPARAEDRLRVFQELLAVAAEIIRTFKIAKPSLQDRLVAARDRLKKRFDLNHSRFCELLGLSERTVRFWAKRKAKPRPKKNTPPKLPPKSRNEGRFDLDVTLPGIQAAADTSDWSLFGIPLKIVACQDPGARHLELWNRFALEDHEDHEVVSKVVKVALGDRPGAQIITDQGTPYLAEEARKLYEELELEHAPQKEGAATDKATLERSFRTVKEALTPLQKFCDRLSDLVPALKSVDCARAVGGLLLGVFLNVYRLAERKATWEYVQDREFLEATVDDQRERARADSRSVKLALQRIHEEYQFVGSSTKFVRSLRRHRVDDILEAERRFREKACRCIAKKCDRYFVGILRNVAEESRRDRKRRFQEIRELSKIRKDHREKEEQEELFREEPEHAIAHALDLLELQYVEKTQRLFLDGKGPGRGRLVRSLQVLRDRFPSSSWDRAEAGWNLWRKETEVVPEAVPLLRQLFDCTVKETLRPSTPSTPQDLAAIFGAGPANKTTGARVNHALLRNYPARSE